MKAKIRWENGRRELLLEPEPGVNDPNFEQLGRPGDQLEGTIRPSGYRNDSCIILNKVEPKHPTDRKKNKSQKVDNRFMSGSKVKTGNSLLIAASGRFVLEWPKFLKCIDFNHTALDCDSVRFMSELPGEMLDALKLIAEEDKS